MIKKILSKRYLIVLTLYFIYLVVTIDNSIQILFEILFAYVFFLIIDHNSWTLDLNIVFVNANMTTNQFLVLILRFDVICLLLLILFFLITYLINAFFFSYCLTL